MTATSAAPATATFIGSSARRIDSTAAMRTSTRRRTAASSSMLRQGCSTYSRPPAAGSSRLMLMTAVSTSQRPLASTRTLPAGPRAARTASTRARSSDSDSGWSATLTFAVRQPEAATIWWAPFRPDRRDGGVDGDAVADGFGPADGGLFDGCGQPGRGFAVVVFGERAELGPAEGSVDEHAFADGDAAEAGVHGDRVDVGGGEVDGGGHHRRRCPRFGAGPDLSLRRTQLVVVEGADGL